jgi:hypothetical protein
MSLFARDPISQLHASRLPEEGKLSRSREPRPRSVVSYAIGALALGAVALGALAVHSMRRSISPSLPLALLALFVGQLTAIARPYQGYVLAFELTPDDGGNVVDCKLRRATHYSPKEVQDPADFHASAALLQKACSTFSHWKVEVRRDRRGGIQPVDAPWQCLARDDTPDEIDCHPPQRERVPID